MATAVAISAFCEARTSEVGLPSATSLAVAGPMSAHSCVAYLPGGGGKNKDKEMRWSHRRRAADGVGAVCKDHA